MANSKKYPRTYHLPYSKGVTDDDKILKNINSFINVEIIISEKLDGGNCSIEKEGIFARTHAKSPSHPSFDCIKSLHSNIKHLLLDNYQFFGENCFALHSIPYDTLPSYFLLFNIRDLNKDIWLSWDEVEEWAKELNVLTVPVLFKGIIKSSKELQEMTEDLSNKPSLYGATREGIVIRIKNEFNDMDFYKSTAKIVRANHVQTTDHWAHQEIVRNKLG